MKRASWTKQVVFCLIAVAVSAGVAWADPIGTASVFQFVQAVTLNDPDVPQQTFRTSDGISFRADYFDPNPACQGVAPVLAQLFIFTAEGLFVQQFSASNGAGFAGPKSRGVFSGPSIPLTPGSYAAAFPVRDCANTKSIVLRDFVSFRVVAP
jgi:hypothetical protein